MPVVLDIGIAAGIVQDSLHLQVVEYPVFPVQRDEGIPPGYVRIEVVGAGCGHRIPAFTGGTGLGRIQFQLQMVPPVVELQGKDIVIAGDGKAVRSYMHAADMVICCLAILVHGRHGTPYNVGSEQPVSIRDLAEMVSAASGKGLPVHILGQAAGGNAPEEYVPDTSALRALMKREPAPSSLGAALAELL